MAIDRVKIEIGKKQEIKAAVSDKLLKERQEEIRKEDAIKNETEVMDLSEMGKAKEEVTKYKYEPGED